MNECRNLKDLKIWKVGFIAFSLLIAWNQIFLASHREIEMGDENCEYELNEFSDTLSASVGSRLALFAKEFGLDRNRIFRSQESGLHFRWNNIIIPKESRKYQIWVYLILVWAVYSSVFTPFEFGFFRGLPANLWWIDQAAQVIFMADVVLSFNVAYKDLHTYRWVSDHRKIALRYAKTNFVPDVLACLPWDVIYKGTGRKELVRCLLWIRLYRVRKVNSFFQKLEKDIRINYMFTRILKLLTVEFYCTHTAACIFYYLATTVPPRKESFTWLGSLTLGGYDFENFRAIDIGRRYVVSLYWAVVTMATVGYGDIHAVNVREMIFVMIFVSLDMILGAYLIGNMTALIVKGSNTEKFRDKMTVLIRYMNRNMLRKDLRTQMKSHIQLQFESKFNEDYIVEDLPFSIRAEISKSLYRSPVKNVHLFNNCSSEFIEQIVTSVHEEFFLPGEVIMSQGSAVDQLYIVSHGYLDEVVISFDGSEETIAHLQPGSVFGEVAVLCNIPQPYTVRVCELSRILRIDKQSFVNILQIYFADGRQMLRNLLKTKDTELRMKQLESDITFLLSKQEAELTLRVNHAAYLGNLTHLKDLVKSGADPGKPDYDGRTPLHLAAAKGHEEIVLFLVSEGANVNSFDNFGFTPLFDALKGGHDKTVSILLENGAKLMLNDANSHLQNAILSGNVNFLRRLLETGEDPNSADQYGRTPLHLAASEGLPMMVKVLIDAGANIHAKDRWGNTPIDECLQNSGRSVLKIFQDSVKQKQDSGRTEKISYAEETEQNVCFKSEPYRETLEPLEGICTAEKTFTERIPHINERKRCTIYPYHPWIPKFKRTCGLVMWVPESLDKLLEKASEHFNQPLFFLFNQDAGEILDTDLIRDSECIYATDSKLDMPHADGSATNEGL